MNTVETPASVCLVGVARCDITPPVGIYHRMWGAATHERSTGVHRPLTATALVLHPASGPVEPAQCQVLIALDMCLLWAEEMRELLDAVAAATGLRHDQLLVCFSHTHGAGLMGKERADRPGGELIGPYLTELSRRVGALVNQARADLRSCVISYGTGRCHLAAQRDFWDEDTKQYVCGLNPEAPADDTVLVGRIADQSGTPVAVVVNYACHPTTLAWQNTLISPDYPGALREVVESATGVPCVFLQGASGDLGPREGFVGEPAVADRNGRQLGYAVLSALASLPPPATRFRYMGPVVSGATIGTWQHEPLDAESLKLKERWDWRRSLVELAYRKDLPEKDETVRELEEWQQRRAQAGDTQAARDAHAMIERLHRRLTRIRDLPPGRFFPMPVVLGKLGDAVWLFVEGEHYQWLQTTLRSRFPGTPILVTTLVNGSRCAYLPTADAYGKGIYQETIAVLEQGCLETLTQKIEEHIG